MTPRLERKTTALVVIDLQEKLLPAVLESERVVKATRLLLRAASVLRLPVLLTTQYKKGLGATVGGIEELVPPEAPRIDKASFSCFDDERFASLLAASAPKAETLLVAGIEAHICVAGTVFGALRRGLAVQVAADAVSSRKAIDLATGQRRMEEAGALVTTAEMAVYELLGRSDSAEFKAMLPYFKGE